VELERERAQVRIAELELKLAKAESRQEMGEADKLERRRRGRPTSWRRAESSKNSRFFE